jgi:hypothetical protein
MTMKHDPLGIMYESMYTLHPSCINLLCGSLKHSVKRTWTGPSFPPMGVLEVQRSQALSLVCEVALRGSELPETGSRYPADVR